MKKVYVVTTGSYSDYGIRAIFADKKNAELLASRLEDANGVEEWELSTLKATKPLWLVFFYGSKAPEAYQNQFAVHREVEEFKMHPTDGGGDALQVGCFAADEAEAIKVASDIRAEYLDRKLNP